MPLPPPHDSAPPQPPAATPPTRRNFFSTTLRPGESAFQLAAEFLGVTIFGLLFIAIGLIPLADRRALGNAALSWVAGSILCLLGLITIAVGIRGIWKTLRQARRRPTLLPPHTDSPPKPTTQAPPTFPE